MAVPRSPCKVLEQAINTSSIVLFVFFFTFSLVRKLTYFCVEEHSDAPSLHVQWTPSTALLKLQDIFGLEPTDTDPYGIEAAHELTEKLVLKRFFLPYAYLPLKQLNSGMEAWLVYMHKTELEQYVLTLDTLPHSVYVDFTSQTGEFRKELSSFLWKRVEIECFVKTSKINLKLYTLLRAVQEPTLEHLEQLVLSKWIAIMRMNTYTKWTSMSSDSGERNEKNILYCYETPYDYLLNWIDYWLPRSEIAHWRRHFTQQKKKFLEEMY